MNKDKFLVFIDLIDRTIAEYQNIQELSVTLKEMERELITNHQRMNLYSKNNEELNIDIDNLKAKIKSQNNEIADLKKKNTLLKSSLKYFKTMIYSLIQFLMDRIHRDKDTEKYKIFAKELYEHGIFDDKRFNFLQKIKQ